MNGYQFSLSCVLHFLEPQYQSAQEIIMFFFLGKEIIMLTVPKKNYNVNDKNNKHDTL